MKYRNISLPCIAALVLLTFSNITVGQNFTKDEKFIATYLINFARHTAWEYKGPSSEVTIGIYNSRNVFNLIQKNLTRTARMSLDGRNIKVEEIEGISKLNSTQVVFVPKEEVEYLKRLKLIGKQGLMLVSEEAGLDYSCIDLYTEKSTILYQVSEKNFSEAGVPLSLTIQNLAKNKTQSHESPYSNSNESSKPASSPETSKASYGKTTETLLSEGKLRENWSVLSDLLYVIPAGGEVEILSFVLGYYKVEYQGKTGYLSENHLSGSAKDKIPQETNVNSSNAGSTVSLITKTLGMDGKLRESDSPTSKIISVIPKGTQLKVHSLSAGVYKAEYRGKKGYINEVYFQVKSKNNSSSQPSTYLKTNTNKWSEYKLKEHWKINGLDEIEGIYEDSYQESQQSSKYKLGVIQNGGDYKLIYLGGAPSDVLYKWSVGDTKATLSPTATPNLFKASWFMGDKSVNTNVFILFENGFFKIMWTDGSQQNLYVKLFPLANSSELRNQKSSGTGFAISSNGLIVTNNHVIEMANSIKVRGINGDFSKVYSARLITTDKNNDLAIIKIDDYNFTSLGSIPYVFKSSVSNVGEDVFVLGYPLRASMGDEIKLTNGIISSKTGFKGDVTSFQVSAPVQPGNSGGPLFDNEGNLIGIISAKHIGAENASYAIKVSYLMNLIDLLDFPLNLQKTNTLSGRLLTEQVSTVKKLVYIIEVN